MTVLHQEELLKISYMLSYRDEISVGRTCRRFHVLSQDDLLLKNIARRELSADRWKINHVYPTRNYEIADKCGHKFRDNVIEIKLKAL